LGPSPASAGAGGSGVVIIRYPYVEPATISNVVTTASSFIVGSNITFTINATNANLTTLYYSTDGNVTASNFIGGNTGSFVANASGGIVTLQANTNIPLNESRSFRLQIRQDSTSGFISGSSANVTIDGFASQIFATGGTITTAGGYRTHTFLTSNNFVLSKEALDLLSGNTYNKDIISNVKEIDMEPDSIFGKITKEAVQEFQKLKGGMKVDGVVGKDTLVNLIKVKEEIIKKEKEALDIEMKKIDTLPMKEIEEIKLDNKEEKEIDLLPPIDVQIEIEKTLKELRKEKKDSKRKRRLLKKLERLQKRENKVQNKIDKISESLLNYIIDYDTFIINEGFFDKLFGKPTVDDAAHDSVRGQGFSHRGKDEENYIMFKGEKFYQDQIEYDDYDSTKPIPRIEGEKLIVANPAWSL
jgi:peptidoglycan hydrolase-like protein with peptidoglycan-binding domain